MKGSLVGRTSRGRRLTIDLPESEVILGRDPDVAIEVPIEGVSRTHARVTWDGTNHWIEDDESTNGTFVNGEPVQRERLRHLDVVGLGKDAELLFLFREPIESAQSVEGVVRVLLIPQPATGVETEIDIGEITIGRSEACNVFVERLDVSKFHARIERTATAVVLHDSDSRNGTFLNDRQVTRAELNDGDIVRIGPTETFGIRIERGQLRRTTSSIQRSALPLQAPSSESGERPQFSADWKTRLEWSDAEREELQRFLAERSAGRPIGGSALETIQPKEDARQEPKPSPHRRGTRPPMVGGLATRAPRLAPPAARAVRTSMATPTPPAAKVPAPTSIVAVSLEGPTSLSIDRPGRYAIGRSPESELRVVDRTVHRRHAWLTLSEDRTRVEIEDGGGSNGTFVNDQAVSIAALQDGDLLRLGAASLRVKFTKR